MRKALSFLAICAVVCASVWGIRACQHRSAMIASVKHWEFVGNYYSPEYYSYVWMSTDSNGGGYLMPIYQQAQYWSEWKGIDIEGHERTTTGAWVINTVEEAKR